MALLEGGDSHIPGACWLAGPASRVSSTLMSGCLFEIQILLSNPPLYLATLLWRVNWLYLCSEYKAE